MRKGTSSVGALLAILALTAATFGQEADRQKAAGRERAERPARGEAAEQGQVALRLRKQLEDLKTEHQDLIAQLRAIHAMALKEKATETAGQVEKLIGQRQQVFQARLTEMERQQQRLQRATKDPAGRTEQVKPQGRPAPQFELKSFDGKTVKLADHKDGIVVLEWFNMECPFVLHHYDKAGTMIDLAKKYKDKNVVWYAVNSTSHTKPEANKEFAQKHKLPHPILDDRSGKVGRLFGALTTPHVFVVSKGVIVYEGGIDNAPLGKVTDGGDKIDYVDKVLSELTSGQPVSVAHAPPYGCSVKYPASK